MCDVSKIVHARCVLGVDGVFSKLDFSALESCRQEIYLDDCSRSYWVVFHHKELF